MDHGDKHDLDLNTTSVLSCTDMLFDYRYGYSERVTHVAAAGFLSRYLHGHLPYVRRHISVNNMC